MSSVNNPIVDATKFVTKAVKDLVEHHSHDGTVTIGKIELLIREQALDTWGHNIQLTVISSPGNKLDGVSTSNTGSSAKKAREKGIQVLTYKVKQTYPEEEKKA